MINPEIQSIIEKCVQELRTGKWCEKDIFWMACGEVLKHAKSQQQEVTPELVAAIEVATRQVMKK
jgi:hypothetical protein